MLPNSVVLLLSGLGALVLFAIGRRNLPVSGSVAA
jgi:hypothetical protein